MRISQSSGEMLDIEDFDALRNYLVSLRRVCHSDVPQLTILRGGVSNRTVRVAWPKGPSWVLKQALPKLRVTADWFSDPARICVEARALRWFNATAPPGTTPGFIFEDPPNFLLAMEAVPEGHKNWKAMLLAGEATSAHFEQFGLLLGTVHRCSSATAGLSQAFAETRFFESLRLEPYYLSTAEKLPSASEFLKTLAHDALNHKLALVHGDFSPKNVLISCNKLILLDYEVAHFGDPAFDVGFALSHFLSKAHHLPDSRGMIADSAKLFWEVYHNEIGTSDWAALLEHRSVSHALGCLLARVCGKSPLEYLTNYEASRQRRAVLHMIAEPESTVNGLIDTFLERIERDGAD